MSAGITYLDLKGKSTQEIIETIGDVGIDETNILLLANDNQILEEIEQNIKDLEPHDNDPLARMALDELRRLRDFYIRKAGH